MVVVYLSTAYAYLLADDRAQAATGSQGSPTTIATTVAIRLCERVHSAQSVRIRRRAHCRGGVRAGSWRAEVVGVLEYSQWAGSWRADTIGYDRVRDSVFGLSAEAYTVCEYTAGTRRTVPHDSCRCQQRDCGMFCLRIGWARLIAAYTRMRPTKKSNFSAVWNIWKKLYTPEPQPAAVSRAAVAHRCGATEPKCTARHGTAQP